MLTNLVEVEPGRVRAGLPVEVVFENLTDEVAVPYFRPSER